MRWAIPAYPVAIAIWFVLDLYRDSGEPTVSLVRPLVVAILVAALVQIVITVLARDRDRGALLAAMFIALALHKVLGFSVMFVTLIVLAWPGMSPIRRHLPPPRIKWEVATPLFNAIGLALVGLTTISLVVAGLLSPPPTTRTARVVTSSPDAPDIYTVLLDGHPRWDTIESWGADGRSFLRELESLDVRPSPGSRSNYNLTALSVGTMLDLHAVTPADATDGFRHDFQTAYDMIAAGRSLDLLHEHGYEVVTIPLGYGPVEVRDADRVLDDGTLQDFEQDLLVESGIRDVAPNGLQSFMVEQRRARVDNAFNALAAIARERPDWPRFVFAHIGLPHLPPAFADDGTTADGWTCPGAVCIRDTMGWTRPMAERVKGVIGNVRQVDARALDAIRTIQAESARPPVILVLSDHGSRIDPNDHAEMFRNLFAAYTPGHPALFSDDQPLIQVLPRLLETYLGESVPTPNDATYWLDIATMRENGLFVLTPMPAIDPAPVPAD